MMVEQTAGGVGDLLKELDEREMLRGQVAELSARVAALEREIQDLLTDRVYSSPGYPVLTRPGVERRWRRRGSEHDTVIFLDLDELRAANSRYGYDEANQRIAAALAVGDSTVVRGRWFSGDEIVYLCNRADAAGLARRLQRELAAQDLAATIGIAPAEDDLISSVTAAARLVQEAKGRDERGGIHFDPLLEAA